MALSGVTKVISLFARYVDPFSRKRILIWVFRTFGPVIGFSLAFLSNMLISTILIVPLAIGIGYCWEFILHNLVGTRITDWSNRAAQFTLKWSCRVGWKIMGSLCGLHSSSEMLAAMNWWEYFRLIRVFWACVWRRFRMKHPNLKVRI